MNKITHYLIYVFLLCCCVSMFITNRKLKKNIEYDVRVDTFVVKDTFIKHDTITIKPLKPNIIKITDTLYIKDSDNKDTTTMLPVCTKEYSDGSTYKAWVSGIYPVLDSIKIYNSTQYINNTIIKKVYPKSWRFYITTGVYRINKEYSPSIGIAATSPNKLIFSLETGIANKECWGGLKIGYKIK